MASPMEVQDNLESEDITVARSEENNFLEREQIRQDRAHREGRDRAHRDHRRRGDRGERLETGRDRQGHRQARPNRGEDRGEDRRHRDHRPKNNKPRRN